MSVSHASGARVSPTVLMWAMERVDTNAAKLARATGTSERVVEKWLSGDRQPSFRQAQEAAKHLHLPFGFLFLDEPPPDSLPIPDFRTLAGDAVEGVSVDLRDVILATLRRQAWLSEFRREEGEPPVEVVGRAQSGQPSQEIADEIREALGIAKWSRPSRQDEFLRELTEKTERLGVYVIRSGVVANNTRRTLDVGEFRGFAISDPYAPFIFINAADAQAAQSFTLVHELSHVWLNETGVSGPLRPNATGTEAQCNRVAAEVLVPSSELKAVWKVDADSAQAVAAAARHFRVSRYVVAIKARDALLISDSTLDSLLKSYRAEDRHKRPSSPGGDFYKTAIVRNSRGFSERLWDAFSRQRVLTLEAAGLLELKPKNLDRFARELLGRG